MEVLSRYKGYGVFEAKPNKNPNPVHDANTQKIIKELSAYLDRLKEYEKNKKN